MPRFRLSAVQRFANFLRRDTGLTAAIPYVGLRVVRLGVDDLPDGLLISASILEWAFALLGVLLILRRRSIKQTEKDNASAS